MIIGMLQAENCQLQDYSNLERAIKAELLNILIRTAEINVTCRELI